MAVPEFVEALLQRAYSRADCEHIVVGELGVGINLEVLVADVASAGQCHGLIGNQQLVVHPVIEPGMMREVLDIPEQPHVAAIGPGVVNANLDVRHAGELKELFVATHRIGVIHEDAYADAARGGAFQSGPNGRAGLVPAEYVVLEIERLLGGINQLDASQKAIDAHGEDVESGLGAMVGHRRSKGRAQAGRARQWDGD